MRLTIIYFSYVNLFGYSKDFSDILFGTTVSRHSVFSNVLKHVFVSNLRNNFNAIVYQITNNNNQLIFTEEF